MTISQLSKNLVFLFLPAVMLSQEFSPKLLEKVEGFSHPESVVSDKAGEMLYISNIGNKEAGDGFISKASGEGKIIDLHWITGLNDPKGLLVVDDFLYVTDKTELVKMSISEGKILETFTVEGSEFLNDLTIDKEGNIYISDLSKSSIYIKTRDSKEVTEWLNSDELEQPNGLLAVDNDLMVGSWGRENPGYFKKVNMASKEVSNITKTGIGNLDGVQITEKGNFLVSDWQTGKIYMIKPEGAQKEILTSEKSAGDILYLPHQKKLVLPMNFQNEVWFFGIE